MSIPATPRALAAGGMMSLLLLPPIAAAAEVAPATSRAFSGFDLLLLALGGTLVFFMQAGFALLESGMSRAKNAVNVLMKNYLDMCFGAVAFWLVGFGLMFGANPSGWFGTSAFAFGALKPGDYAFFFYQVMFAATAATIVSGAVAERTHFKAYIIGSIVISALIYPVFGSWVWGGWFGGEGWLTKLGFIDFAGSTVVHSIGGWCALAALLIVKPRLGRFAADGTPRTIPPHNLTSATLGALVLWLGWFGFNGGSVALVDNGIDGLLGRVVTNTHLAGAGGALGALLAMSLGRSKVRLTVTLNGSIGGLVGVTAGAHLMEPGFALLTGLIAGMVVTWVESLLLALRVDDVVGAVAVHLGGGIWGTLAAGLFNPATFLSFAQLKVQLLGIFAAGAWAFSVALLAYWLIDRILGMRATLLQEQRGLDFSEHAETGYPEFQRDLVHQAREH